jgi:hypothetical protein
MSQAELSQLNLAEDYERARGCPDASRWGLGNPGPLEVWVTMYPSGCPDEKFQSRLLWTEYPQHPPSLKFRDPPTGRLDMPSAWPQVRGFRPTSLDACVNWCLEGFNLHPEWRNDPRLRWDPRGNALLRVLRTLQEELDNYFQGRFRG